MMLKICLVLLSTTVLCQSQNNGQFAYMLFDQQTGKEIPWTDLHPYVQMPSAIDSKQLIEYNRVEEAINSSRPIESIGSKIFINSTNRYNSTEHSNPWIVAVYDNRTHICTGSILNKEWIITAAHCFPNNDTSRFTILTGTTLHTDGNEYRLSKIILHPRYDAPNYKTSDVALLKINGTIHMSESIKPIELPAVPFEEPVPGHQLVTSGWGKENINSNETDHYLGEIWVTIIQPELCASAYKKLGENGFVVFRSQICTWNLNQNICQGNSGGPAVIYKEDKAVLIGVVSYGVKCLDKYPVVFSKTSYFLHWINQTMFNNRI